MSRRTLTADYHCYNDCQMQGCPGHTATLTLQTVSDNYTFDDGRGFAFSVREFDPTLLEIFQQLVAEVQMYEA